MQYKYSYQQLASTYGSNPYNTSTYNGASTGSTSGTGSDAGGSLVNTGVAVAGIVTLAAVVLLVAVIVRVWKRPNRSAATPAEPTQTPPPNPQA